MELRKIRGIETPLTLHPYTSGKAALKTRNFRRKFKIGKLKTFLCPIYYESGLVFLDENILDRIEDSIVIDCGAYWGDTALVFSQYNPSLIYGFEPSEYWFKEFERVVCMNELADSIIPVKLGVSDKSGHFYYQEADTTSHLTEEVTEQVCNVTTLDVYFNDKSKRVGLIKFDVEGEDFAALKGAKNIIMRDNPILLTSIYHHPEHFFQVKQYLDNLNIGYKHKIRKLAKSPLCDLMLISWVE